MRLSAPAMIKVDDLIKIYDGVLPEVAKILQAQEISEELPTPDLPAGAEDYILTGPMGDPLLPADLTQVPNVAIGQLFTLFVNWTNYIQSRLTSAECARDVIKAKLSVLLHALMITAQEEDSKMSATKAKSYAHLDIRYATAEGEYTAAVMISRKLATRFEQLKRSEKVISREQSRRQTELDSIVHDEKGGNEKPFRGRQPFRRP
jgi:hypothetical protein